MNESKRETMCASCIHKDICESIKKGYLEAVEYVAKSGFYPYVIIDVRCVMYVVDRASREIVRKGLPKLLERSGE